ncbi:MAG: hypothetical protein JNJ41_08365 [Bacteroidia bacterium]|nr:hypothetical protein [Bacteroidia bacterium]
MKSYILALIFLSSCFNLISQNIKYTGLSKIYYYKTVDRFFAHKKDSFVGKDMVYNYGKLSYVDEKTNRKIKFRLHKDSAIFAFRLDNGTSHSPIYAINNGEKRYGVYMGGSKDLFLVLYSQLDFYSVNYDKENYALGYGGAVNQFGYYIMFTKKGLISKKNGSIEHFIQDNEELYKKYMDFKANATTYNFNKNYVSIQIEYLYAYNH